jgi:hypothetical protein
MMPAAGGVQDTAVDDNVSCMRQREKQMDDTLL